MNAFTISALTKFPSDWFSWDTPLRSKWIVGALIPLRLSARAEPSAVLRRVDECFHHLSSEVVTLERLKLVQPEVVTLKVQRRFRHIVRIASQVTEVLHQDEGTVELGGDKIGILRDGSQNLPADPCPKCQIPR